MIKRIQRLEVTIKVRFPPSVIEKLQKAAERAGQPLSTWIRAVVLAEVGVK